MEAWVRSSVHWLLLTLALPEVGLSAVFVISLLSATLLPLGSEAAVFAFLKLDPSMFWWTILVATLGNTLGGIITYGMGLAAEKGYERWHEKHGHTADHSHKKKAGGRWHTQISNWVHHFGPAALFFSWLPFVGDPLCAVAGWLKLSFWPCVLYMALGKFLRYAIVTAALIGLFPKVI